jgi:hypothetical protein
MGRSGKHSWYRLVLAEGKNREVRRLCAAVELEVLRLKRVAYGPLELGTMPRGAWRELTPHEVQKLKALLHTSRPTTEGTGAPRPSAGRSRKPHPAAGGEAPRRTPRRTARKPRPAKSSKGRR